MAREKHVDEMTNDELFARWLTRIEPIRHELKWLYASRRQFRAVTEMFETNPQLNAIGGRVFEWLKEMWIHDTVLNVRRELDDKRNVESFGVLLDEASKRPQVLTRRRFVHGIAEDDYRWDLLNEKFAALGVSSRKPIGWTTIWTLPTSLLTEKDSIELPTAFWSLRIGPSRIELLASSIAQPSKT